MNIPADLVPILAFFSFWLGACIASFLNVVIYRVPRGESIVSPPSHCPTCRTPIRWYQNLPILSWLALRGKCAQCKAPISSRYILVEILGGVLFLAAFWRVVCPAFYAFPLYVLPLYWIWISLMIVGSFIDFDHQLLPDFVTVGGMILGVLSAGFECVVWGFWLPLAKSVGGLAFGFGLMWLIRFLGSRACKREAMGMGDVFLMGAIGAIFGWECVIVTLMLSSVIGSLVGVGMILLSKAKLGKFVAIPFGPYLCMGCLVWMFWGPQLVDWYLRLLGVVR